MLVWLAILLLPIQQAAAIVNGEPLSDEDFATAYPWMVALVNSVNGGICGGALIAPRWVVTAAHCTGMNRYVLAGDADRTKASRIEVERAIRHPDFDRETLQNDVGLLYLAEPVSATVATLATPTESRLLLIPGAAARIAGWGKPAHKQLAAERLVEGKATLMGLVRRGSQYIYDDPATGPCGFDSGGPMTMSTLDGRMLLVGVASATDGNLCAQGGGIAIFTSLASVADFLESHVRAGAAE